MSEGKLKQRSLSNGFITNHFLKSDKFVSIIDINEAKKDFPLELDYSTNEMAIHHLSHKNAMKKLGEIALWYEKWLGGSS